MSITGAVLKEWDQHGIREKVYDGYFQYQQERIQNTYDDIDSLLTMGKNLINRYLPMESVSTD